VNVPPVIVRPADPTDLAAVEDAVVWAFNWSPDRPALDRNVVLSRPDVAHYVVGWPAAGELGVVAEVAGQPVGAAWLRFLPADDPGYGFVADGVPELSIGVHPDHRGRGIGRSLLRTLLAAAARLGIAQVSLSVEHANWARNLYSSEGFAVVGGAAGADTMLAVLDHGGGDGC
jgi:ribosomal protein S18 acetylase RimI-like enzyme